MLVQNIKMLGGITLIGYKKEDIDNINKLKQWILKVNSTPLIKIQRIAFLNKKSKTPKESDFYKFSEELIDRQFEEKISKTKASIIFCNCVYKNKFISMGFDIKKNYIIMTPTNIDADLAKEFGDIIDQIIV